MGLFLKLQALRAVYAVDSECSSRGIRCSLDPVVAPGWFVVEGLSFGSSRQRRSGPWPFPAPPSSLNLERALVASKT